MIKCQVCGSANRDSSRFCSLCGRRLGAAVICAACGASNPGDARFCDSCGVTLGTTKAAPTGPPEPIDQPAIETEIPGSGNLDQSDSPTAILPALEPAQASPAESDAPKAEPSWLDLLALPEHPPESGSPARTADDSPTDVDASQHWPAGPLPVEAPTERQSLDAPGVTNRAPADQSSVLPTDNAMLPADEAGLAGPPPPNEQVTWDALLAIAAPPTDPPGAPVTSDPASAAPASPSVEMPRPPDLDTESARGPADDSPAEVASAEVVPDVAAPVDTNEATPTAPDDADGTDRGLVLAKSLARLRPQVTTREPLEILSGAGQAFAAVAGELDSHGGAQR